MGMVGIFFLGFRILDLFEVVVGVVFAGGGKVVVGEVGEEGLELEEEALAGEVAVGGHVEGSGEFGVES